MSVRHILHPEGKCPDTTHLEVYAMAAASGRLLPWQASSKLSRLHPKCLVHLMHLNAQDAIFFFLMYITLTVVLRTGRVAMAVNSVNIVLNTTSYFSVFLPILPTYFSLLMFVLHWRENHGTVRTQVRTRRRYIPVASYS